VGTRNTVARVHGITRVAKLGYRTRTHKTRDLKPAGFPVPVTYPSSRNRARRALSFAQAVCCGCATSGISHLGLYSDSHR
jgi:hypothetical protein